MKNNKIIIFQIIEKVKVQLIKKLH